MGHRDAHRLVADRAVTRTAGPPLTLILTADPGRKRGLSAGGASTSPSAFPRAPGAYRIAELVAAT